MSNEKGHVKITQAVQAIYFQMSKQGGIAESSCAQTGADELVNSKKKSIFTIDKLFYLSARRPTMGVPLCVAYVDSSKWKPSSTGYL